MFLRTIWDLILKPYTHHVMLMNHSEFEEIYSSNELYEKLRLETVEKCNVSDLPEGHDAIVIEEKPTVRVYSKR